MDEQQKLSSVRTVNAITYPEPMFDQTRNKLLTYFEPDGERLFEILGYRVDSLTS